MLVGMRTSRSDQEREQHTAVGCVHWEIKAKRV